MEVAEAIVALLLCLAGILGALSVARFVFVSPSLRLAPWHDRRLVSKVMFTLLLMLLAYSEYFSVGRPVFSVSIAAPGSLVTRSLTEIDFPWLRRLFEPSLLFFLLCLGTAAADTSSCYSRRGYLACSFGLVAMVLMEVYYLLLGPLGRPEGNFLWLLNTVHYALVQGVLLCLLCALFFELCSEKNVAPTGAATSCKPRAVLFRPVLFLPALILFMGAIPAILLGPCGRAVRPLLGVHYYSWFPENWQAGFVGERLKPPVLPLLGRYSSKSPEVFSQHVSWLKQAGVGFIVFDWWPKRPSIGQNIYEHVVRKKRLGGLEFSLMYETADLKEEGDATFPGEEENVIYMNRERSFRLKKHWEYLAKHYMDKEGYLRFGGRPVLFVYASRHLVGPTARAIREAREHVLRTTGHRLFLVGDEIYFNVLTHSPEHGLLLLPDFVPNWDRAASFDALTFYNPYDAARKEHGGEAGALGFLADIEELLSHYRGIASVLGIPVFPSALPAYNDRGVRLHLDHHVVPRAFTKNGQRKLFLGESLRRWGKAYLDWKLPVLTITSWNEWNEGTQIEPSALSPATREDQSPGGRDYTLGEEHKGCGEEYLKLIEQISSRVSP